MRIFKPFLALSPDLYAKVKAQFHLYIADFALARVFKILRLNS